MRVFQKKLFVFIVLILSAFNVTLTLSVNAQENTAAATDKQTKENSNKENQEKKTNKPAKPEKYDFNNLTAEQLAEVVIANYGGRVRLATIRKTEIERGRVTRFVENAPPQDSSYEKHLVRGENQEKDRVRLNQKLTEAQYALVYDASKTFGIINDAVFVPREEANNNFQAAIFHGLDALLRYKENGSNLKLLDKDTQMGVDLHHLEVTDKQNRTTRFNISRKFYRVISLEYSLALTANGVPTKFIRKFYDYRLAQGTLVPYRTVLYADGKPIEETNLSTITYGTKIEDAEFQSGE